MNSKLEDLILREISDVEAVVIERGWNDVMWKPYDWSTAEAMESSSITNACALVPVSDREVTAASFGLYFGNATEALASPHLHMSK